MKSTDRGILLGLIVLGVFAAFWFMVLSPKREEAAELQTQIDETRASLEQQQQLATYAEQAKEEYDDHYRRLVVLGKAVPEDDDTSTLFEQVNTIATSSGVEFRDIELTTGGQAAPPPAPAPTTPAPEAEGGNAASEPAPAAQPVAATAPVATEATAAALPIGATVGPAGLPIMPYDVVLRGDFFQIADSLDGLDDLVHADEKGVRVGGRLLTIDGFNLEQDRKSGFPSLKATVALTTYVVPESQGLLGGASPTTPATSVPAAVTPTTTPTTPAPTATTPATTTTPAPAP
jgi:hypothetical protein